MTCQRTIDEFLIRYFDGELTLRERLSFRFHLAICPNCRRYVASYREAIALGKATLAEPEAPVSADVPEALIQAILAARKADE